MTDFAGLRVQLDLHLRGMRAGTIPAASPEAVTVAEQAVDVGNQEMLLAAAEALGLTAAPEVPAAPAEPEASAAPEAPAPEVPAAPAEPEASAAPEAPAPEV